jgi:hypothetical protein
MAGIQKNEITPGRLEATMMRGRASGINEKSRWKSTRGEWRAAEEDTDDESAFG